MSLALKSCGSILILAVLGLQACSKPVAPAPEPVDTRATDEAAVRETASQWERVIALRDVDQIVSYYAEDGWQLPAAGEIARTDAERRVFWDQIAKLPVANDTVDVVGRIEVARSGELAVQYGTFRQIITDKQGNLTSVPQKFVTTWRKQTDGTWKISASMATVETVTAELTSKKRG